MLTAYTNFLICYKAIDRADLRWIHELFRIVAGIQAGKPEALNRIDARLLIDSTLVKLATELFHREAVAGRSMQSISSCCRREVALTLAQSEKTGHSMNIAQLIAALRNRPLACYNEEALLLVVQEYFGENCAKQPTAADLKGVKNAKPAINCEQLKLPGQMPASRELTEPQK